MGNDIVWIIEPRDPFIARDGKPFGVGGRAGSLPFPFPSTTTGGIRTRAGLTQGSFIDSNGQPHQGLISAVRQIAVRGPLLVEVEDGEIKTWLMPAPADALLLEDKLDNRKAYINRLVPLDADTDLTNLNQAPHEYDKLRLVGLTDPDQRKPFNGAPRFWYWERFKEWLLAPGALMKTTYKLIEGRLVKDVPDDPNALMAKTDDPPELGHNGAISETR